MARVHLQLPDGTCLDGSGPHTGYLRSDFHGCYSVGDDRLWGITRRRKGADHTLAALRSIRAARPDGQQLYVILDGTVAPAVSEP